MNDLFISVLTYMAPGILWGIFMRCARRKGSPKEAAKAFALGFFYALFISSGWVVASLAAGLVTALAVFGVDVYAHTQPAPVNPKRGEKRT